MLQQEADIYEVLSNLQGQCIPKIYGFFGSEHLKVLIMTYMGRMVGPNISDLNMDQRRAFFCLMIFCLIIPSMAILIVVSYWKNFVSSMNTELCMETFRLPTLSCRMDLMLILSISCMHTNINAQGVQHALSLWRHIGS
ncbi:hypothetical protein PILCRDRAFT_766288, partial [Piloderma croceum F 1598]